MMVIIKVMNKFLLAIATILLLLSGNIAEARKSYGKGFKVLAVQTPEQITEKLKTLATIPNVTVQGQISQVCQAEGCWMKLKNSAGEDILVKFKNHSFVIPKDQAGKATIVYGTAIKKTISVEEQRHMAEDAGKTKEEIEAITIPKIEVRIEATGIVID